MITKILKKSNNLSQKGFGMIEIILVIGVGMAVFLGIEQYLNISLKAAIEDSHQTEALYWVKANLEQARAVRDEDWNLISGLTPGNQYAFIVNSAVYPVPESWEVQTGTRTEGRYTVWFTVSQVNRDAASDDIVAVGGVVDPNTLKINSNISWLENGATKQVTVSEYLTNFK